MTRPWLRRACLALHPPVTLGHPARYALTTFTVRESGLQSGKILLDGSLKGVSPMPTQEELLEAFDAVLRQNMLG